MAKTRRSYKGAATSTTTTSAIASSGTTSFTISAYTGWPYGTDPFYVVVEPGTANEEKILVTRSGSTDTTVSVYSTPSVAANRGVDGTSAAAHSSGATIYPVFTAVDADEANELASTLTTKGDILTHGSTTFARVAVGTNDYVLTADSAQSSGLKWGQVQTAGIATDAVTAAKIASGAVGSDELASNAVTTAKITDSNVTTAKIADSNVTAAKLGTSAVETAKINDSAVTTAKINDGAVTVAKLGLTELKIRRTTSDTYTSSGGSLQYVDLVWDTEDADVDGFFTASSDSFTIPSGKTGMYAISGECSVSGTSPGVAQAFGLVVNGVTVGLISDQAEVATVSFIGMNGIMYLEASDVVKCRVTVVPSSGSVTIGNARLWLTRIMD